MSRLLHCTLFCCVAAACAIPGCVPPASLRAVEVAIGPCLEAARAAPAKARGAARVAKTRNVILVAVDGVRFQEVFGGVDLALARRDHILGCEGIGARSLLPNLYARTVDGGVAIGAPGHGEPIAASGSNFVSLPGYLELLGGRTSSLTRQNTLFGRVREIPCADNDCGPVVTPTLLDGLRGDGFQPGEVAAIASWEWIENAASRDPGGITLSTGRHHGATRDSLRVTAHASALLDQAAASSPRPGSDDYRADRFTAALALEYLRATRPRFLFVGLGDTDEFAHRRVYRGYLEALRAADRFAGELFATLDGMGRYGEETTVFFTADHGRADDFAAHGPPESGRVWLLAGGGAIPALGLVHATEKHHLADVAPTIRALLDLPPEHSANPADDGRAIDELIPKRL